jgi:quercetin dioxygenase-like cupin family protein
MSVRTLLPSDEAQSLALADAVQTSAAGIVSRTVLQAEPLRVVLFAFAEGQELTSHTSTRRALVHVLSGSCEFFFAGDWHTLGAGSLLHLPPNHPHAVRAAHGPFSMLLTLGTESSAPAAAPSTPSL